MYMIVIRRFVRPDREAEFLSKYEAEKSKHPDFRGETLSKIVDAESVPACLKGLLEIEADCINFLNIARWESWESFNGQCEMSGGYYDKELETRPRERLILEVIREVPGVREAS